MSGSNPIDARSMTSSQRVAKNSVFELLTYAVRSITLVVTPFLIARLAGSELLGDYVTVISLAMIFVFLATVGLPRLLTREVARFRDDIDRTAHLLGTALVLVAVMSVVTMLALMIAGVALGYSSTLLWALFVAGIALAFEALTNVVAAGFRGHEQMHWATVATLLAEVVFLIAVIAIVATTPRLGFLVAALAISRLMSFTLALAIYRRAFGRLEPSFDRGELRRLLIDALPFATNDSINIFQGQLGIIILSTLAGNVVVALWEVTVSLTQRLNVIGRAVNDALYPVLARAHREDEDAFRRYSARALHLLLIPGFLLTALLWIFGDELLSLYGDDFADAGRALRILAALIPLRFVINTVAVSLFASDRQRERAAAVGVSAFVNVVLSFALIPPFGLMGAVYATVAMEVVQIAMLIGFTKKGFRGIVGVRAFVAPAVGCAAMAVTAYFVANLWATVVLSTLLYVAAVAILDRESLESIGVVLKRFAL